MNHLDNTILNDLKKASTEKEIELIFGRTEIIDAVLKLSYLKECQGLDSFYTPNYATLSSKQKYQYEIAIFLKGDWKKNKLYERMDL